MDFPPTPAKTSSPRSFFPDFRKLRKLSSAVSLSVSVTGCGGSSFRSSLERSEPSKESLSVLLTNSSTCPSEASIQKLSHDASFHLLRSLTSFEYLIKHFPC